MDGLKKLRHALVRRLIRRGTLPQDAEDAIHDAFVRLCLAQKREVVRNPAAFLTDVVMKVRVEKWRSSQRYHRLFVDEPAEDLDLVDLAPRPEEYLQADQRLERMWRRLGALSPRTREIFFLHRLQGLSYAQIAASMGVSVSAIEKHIARAALLISDEMHGE
jgi:RNA polymerase sigma factor (sigma-70 family)